MLTTSSVPPLYHAILTTPVAALMNAMACRVFRNIKFGDYLEEISTLPTSMFSPPHTSSSGKPEAHLSDERSRSIAQIIFHPEPMDSFKVDSMWNSASNKHELWYTYMYFYKTLSFLLDRALSFSRIVARRQSQWRNYSLGTWANDHIKVNDQW